MLDFLKTIVQTVFRFVGFPTKTGLREFGHPGPKSPVFVTSNFDLTVRRVSKEIENLDCYLLVAPTKGKNVWCAAGGGIFNARSVISVLKTSGIGERVKHRTLILPQLSAPGVDPEIIKRETGWRCKFGPVYAKDIPGYIENGFKKTQRMRLVEFPLSARLEMASMWGGMLSLLVGIPVAILALRSLPGVLALIWGMALAMFIFYSYLPGKVGLFKGLFVALITIVALALYPLFFGHWSNGRLVAWGVGILILGSVLGFDFEGQSPIYAASTITFWAGKWPIVLKVWARLGYVMEPFFTVGVDAERCSGCGICVEVCPKGVYEMYASDRGGKKARVVALDACVQCTACVKQCPREAIWADPPIKRFERVEGAQQ